VGYPPETEDDYDLTKEFIAGHPLDDIFVSVAEPIPSTPLASLTIRTPKEKNPLYISHTGEYRPLGLTEAEARFFDLTLHAAMSRTRPFIVAGQSYDAYLGEARKQGREIRAVTELLYKYYRE
jgi:radical SAM superfamily enzyme YgiQ (UPF0313 family)